MTAALHLRPGRFTATFRARTNQQILIVGFFFRRHWRKCRDRWKRIRWITWKRNKWYVGVFSTSP